LGLTKALLFPEFGFQIATIADLGYYIAVTIARENFVTLENIRVVEFFEYINFGK